MREDAGHSVLDPSRGAEQDHSIVAFAMAYSRRQLLAKAAIAASRVGS
jgi:hypothetical protein